MKPILTTPAGEPIDRWQDWTRPKRDYQWKEGRSAMCLAKAWFNEKGEVVVPAELESLLSSHHRLEDLEILTGVPEKVTPLPERWEGRNHDLWLQCRTPSEQVTICIEAKADEPFGNETVGGYRQRMLEQRRKGKQTRAPERIDSLLQIVGDPVASFWEDIPYQLLTALCGTVLQAQADGSSLAVFVVHEFHTSLTESENLQRNAEALKSFMRVFVEQKDFEVVCGDLYEAGVVDGVEVLLGKAQSLR